VNSRDGRNVPLDRRGLLSGRDAAVNERPNRLGIRGQIGLASRITEGLEYRPIRLLRPERIGRIRALRHGLPFEQRGQRALKHGSWSDRLGIKFRSPDGRF
jgi:hypothetical protein